MPTSRNRQPDPQADHLQWPIVPGNREAAGAAALPAGILTTGPPFRHESMPHEVTILLPTNRGPGPLIEAVLAQPALLANTILGLFLASPFLNVKLESARLARAGCGWITNLPSVVQQDEEFSRQLADVGLGFDRELESLAQFRAAGFRVAAVVADARSAAAAAAIDPEAMIVLPRVADFAAGFPSLRQRSSAVQAVADAARGKGWSGALLGLGEAGEANNPGLWPHPLDGFVCRPEATST